MTRDESTRPFWHWICLPLLAAWSMLAAWSLVQAWPAYLHARGAAPNDDALHAAARSFDTPLVLITLSLLAAVGAAVLLWRRRRGRPWIALFCVSLVVLSVWWFALDNPDPETIEPWCAPMAVTLPLRLSVAAAGLVFVLSVLGMRGLSEPQAGDASVITTADELRAARDMARSSTVDPWH